MSRFFFIYSAQFKNILKTKNNGNNQAIGTVYSKLSMVFRISYFEFCILITSFTESEKIERNKIQGKCKVQQFHITDRIVE